MADLKKGHYWIDIYPPAGSTEPRVDMTARARATQSWLEQVGGKVVSSQDFGDRIWVNFYVPGPVSWPHIWAKPTRSRQGAETTSDDTVQKPDPNDISHPLDPIVTAAKWGAGIAAFWAVSSFLRDRLPKKQE